MKIFLMILNILLAGAVLFGTVENLRRTFSRKADTDLAVKKKPRDGKIYTDPAKSTRQSLPPPSKEEVFKKITENNLFYTGRSPNANMRSSRNMTLTLVGTFTIGKVSGAIIKHNIQQDNRTNAFGMWRRNAYGMMGAMGPGMMPPMGGNNAANSGLPQRNVNQRRNGNVSGNADNSLSGQRGSFRRRFQGGNNNMPLPPGMMPGMFTGMNQSRSTAAQVQRQYVRIGETLSNGYTLVEVTRTTATLMRGSDKMELELQESSKGLTSARRTVNSKQTSQQILQQGMQQMQNILRQQGMQQNFMMRQMMRNNSSNQNQRGTPAARRR
ncbi:MAG: hypothetical protein J6S53_10565 [Lentisphaeria bacterium]|nr:hypothetical protein [Lentisphaeria bacterium]